ncbi:hypothetical protein [Desulfovibrio ferrophilus]|uniref:Primosomal protein N n=1 Tax=Desulfovibrio ferrophilus TaxID=241368 RepID=A0A2Z6AUB3_9BACT|nr:hypothetical protein [Desulfovibrio ferrophilus]BBD06822.1 primosomal protein N [Desulfovibrio ferrophilus]
MTKKTYEVQADCPHCGTHQMLHIEASEYTALPQGKAPEALSSCPDCGKPYNAPVNPDSCAEWDDFCNEIHPVPQV